VKKLVEPDSAALSRIAQQIAVKQHEALPDESGGVRGLTGRIAELGAIGNADGAALEKFPDSLQ
jgi:hypothetical protein